MEDRVHDEARLKLEPFIVGDETEQNSKTADLMTEAEAMGFTPGEIDGALYHQVLQNKVPMERIFVLYLDALRRI